MKKNNNLEPWFSECGPQTHCTGTQGNSLKFQIPRPRPRLINQEHKGWSLLVIVMHHKAWDRSSENSHFTKEETEAGRKREVICFLGSKAVFLLRYMPMGLSPPRRWASSPLLIQGAHVFWAEKGISRLNQGSCLTPFYNPVFLIKAAVPSEICFSFSS